MPLPALVPIIVGVKTAVAAALSYAATQAPGAVVGAAAGYTAARRGVDNELRQAREAVQRAREASGLYAVLGFLLDKDEVVLRRELPENDLQGLLAALETDDINDITRRYAPILQVEPGENDKIFPCLRLIVLLGNSLDADNQHELVLDMFTRVARRNDHPELMRKLFLDCVSRLYDPSVLAGAQPTQLEILQAREAAGGMTVAQAHDQILAEIAHINNYADAVPISLGELLNTALDIVRARTPNNAPTMNTSEVRALEPKIQEMLRWWVEHTRGLPQAQEDLLKRVVEERLEQAGWHGRQRPPANPDELKQVLSQCNCDLERLLAKLAYVEEAISSIKHTDESVEGVVLTTGLRRLITLLKDFSCLQNQNETILVWGPPGNGKSTVVPFIIKRCLHICNDRECEAKGFFRSTGDSFKSGEDITTFFNRGRTFRNSHDKAVLFVDETNNLLSNGWAQDRLRHEIGGYKQERNGMFIVLCMQGDNFEKLPLDAGLLDRCDERVYMASPSRTDEIVRVLNLFIKNQLHDSGQSCEITFADKDIISTVRDNKLSYRRLQSKVKQATVSWCQEVVESQEVNSLNDVKKRPPFAKKYLKEVLMLAADAEASSSAS